MNEKMYQNPRTDFKDFFDYVLSNKNAKKSYFLYDGLRIPHDTIIHDNNGHQLTYREWENYLQNRFNIIEECIGYEKRYDGSPKIQLVDVMGTLYIAIIEYFNKAYPIITTLFTDHENSILSYFNNKKEFAKARQKTSATTEGMLLSHNSKNIIKPNNEKCKSNVNYCEDLTFFKDDEDKNQNGSRVKNPKRVFAAKKAHKTHGASYQSANNRRGTEMKQDRASLVVEKLEKFLESKIEQNNPVNLYANINSENTTMGVEIKFDENNLNNVDITFTTQDKEGVGAYQLEFENADKMEASNVYQMLVNDLNSLLTTFDNDFEAVLKKNGIVRRVD